MGELDYSSGLDLTKLSETQKNMSRPVLPSHFLGWPQSLVSLPLRNQEWLVGKKVDFHENGSVKNISFYITYGKSVCFSLGLPKLCKSNIPGMKHLIQPRDKIENQKIEKRKPSIRLNKTW